MGDLSFVWLLADTLNALMALPNLIALLLLSPVIFKLTTNSINKAVIDREKCSYLVHWNYF